MTPMQRFIRGMRQAGAQMLRDPRAVDRWRRTLEQRERLREQAELDAMFRAMNGKDKT